MNLRLYFFRIRIWLLYYWRAVTKYNIQSPFFTKFVKEVMDISKEYYVFGDIEKERKKLYREVTNLPVIDFGAGSQKIKTRNTVRVKDIAKTSLSTVSQCRILFNLIMFQKPGTIIELGTSLGISTAYLASAVKSAKLFSFEGNPHIAANAQKLMWQIKLKNVQIETGVFAETLPAFLASNPVIDLAFIDGHHEKNATIQYFKMMQPFLSDDAVVVFDDINWSEDMVSAWQSICELPSVAATFEIFDMGFVFMRKGLTKEHITYIPFIFKPWKIGLFGN